jgi:hypothetical protein
MKPCLITSTLVFAIWGWLGGCTPSGTGGSGHSGPPAAVTLDRDPHFHMLFENSLVRAWLLELKPGESTYLDNHHNDFLQIPIQSAWLARTSERAQPVPFWPEPNARFVRGGFRDVLKNTDPKTVVRIVEVEFFENVGTERCGPEAQTACSCWGDIGGIVHKIGCDVLQTDSLRVSQLESGTGLSGLPTLVIAITSAKIVDKASSPVRTIVLNPGESAWVDMKEQWIAGPDEHTDPKTVAIEFKVTR